MVTTRRDALKRHWGADISRSKYRRRPQTLARKSRKLCSRPPSEILVYLIGFLIAKLLFRVTLKEAILIGAASAFANHVLYVYPIALLEFSFEEINPLVTIMAMDEVLLSITIFLLDLVSTKDISVVQLLKKQAFNPPLIGLLIGLTIIVFPFDFCISHFF